MFFLVNQFDRHHLLRCISVWRLLRRGHLRDDLRHGLLWYLHDGDGQADPSGQLGLERESSTCLVTHTYSNTHCWLHNASSSASLFSAGSFPCWYWRCPLHHHFSDLRDRRSRGRRSYRRRGQLSINSNHKTVAYALICFTYCFDNL